MRLFRRKKDNEPKTPKNELMDIPVGSMIELSDMATFNLEEKATQTFELKAKSSIFGEVYAPTADIELYPGADLSGAIVGKSISIKSSGTFKYDEALKDVSPDDEGARFVIERWWE